MKTNGKHEVVARIVRRSLVLAAVLGMVLCAAGVSRAQSGSASAAAPAKNAGQAPELASAAGKTIANHAAAAPSSSGMNTGVKVHGHWTIVVRNPDGTVTDRRDFENSLAFGGAYLLQNILGGTVTPGAWAISLGAQLPGNTGPCDVGIFTILNGTDPAPVSNGNCIIGEASGRYLGLALCQLPSCAPNLTRQQLAFRVAEFSLDGQLSESISGGGFELTGTATTTAAGTIDTVVTSLMLCPSTTTLTTTTVPPLTVNPTLTALSDLGPSACVLPVVGGEAEKTNLQSIPSPFGNKWGGVFSSKLLNGATATSTPPAAVQVVANQTVQVSVVFTFN